MTFIDRFPKELKKTKWLLADLKVGESQLVREDESGYQCARKYSWVRGKRLGVSFSCRKTAEGKLVTRTA